MPDIAAFQRIDVALYEFFENGVRYKSNKMRDQVILKQHLAFTLFVPGGKADRARKAIDELTAAGYFEGKITKAAAAKIIRPNVRFFNTKMNYLTDILKHWSEFSRNVSELDLTGRWQWLLGRKGFGMKAAAHFMRNTGLTWGSYAIPIIDVHIHKLLDALNYKHDTYMEASDSFQGLARILDQDVHFMDACIWCAYANNWNIENADFDNFKNTNLRRMTDESDNQHHRGDQPDTETDGLYRGDPAVFSRSLDAANTGNTEGRNTKGRSATAGKGKGSKAKEEG